MTDLSSETVHASCVAIGETAVLLEGPSGAGKSDLAFRLIDRGAMLVSDDYTLLVRSGDRLIARPPERIAGKIEIRGVGLVDLPFVADRPVTLIVCLQGEALRLPENRTRRIAGVEVRELVFAAFHASTPAKIELALGQADID